jgi:glycosyltransferase involved in cell wall biosynthesis
VLHIGPDPAFVGGIGSVIAVLAEHRIGGEAVTSVPSWRPRDRLRNTALSVRAAAAVTAAPQDTVIHVHLAEGGSFIREGGLLAWARLAGRRTVATIHGADFLPFARRAPRLVARVLAQSHVITCLDAAVAERVRALLPGADIELLANPVTVLDNPRPADATEEIVLFAGEVSRRKGADVLAQAWAMVRAARPCARLIVAGPPRDVRLPDAEGIEVRGALDRQEVGRLLREARVVALPSRAEGMPMILSEAMGAARPFVSTPVGAIPELSAGGVLVPVGDAGALAESLVALLADPQLALLIGDRGREHCEATRSPGVIDTRLRALYGRAEHRAG